MRCILKNAKVFSQGVFHLADVFLSDGKIVSIGNGVSRSDDTITIDISNMVLFPGFVDVHVHLREPGFSYKETIRTGTLAAAHGGFAHVAAMPNLNPVPDCVDALNLQRALNEKDALVHVHPYGAITVGEKGEQLADLAGMAPNVIAFSDDGRGVQSESMMRQAMAECRRLGKILAAHCEDNSLLRGGYIHDGAYARAHGHRGICSESEWGQIARDVKLAEETGCAYHVCHVSTKESVEVIRAAKRRGVNVTCETAPHYLAFTQDDLQEDGRFKMNPPLRSREDRAALIAGVADGTIEVIATDHAPHTAEEKSRGLAGSAMGIVGLECAFPLMYKYMVLPGTLTLEKLVALMSDNPRRIFGLGGGLNVGGEADFTVLALGAQYEIDPAAFLSKGRATPFAGWPVQGRAVLTVVGGREAYRDDGLQL